ncbi:MULTISPECIES: ABC transporter ATP-binding protein [unclassified Clostridioides]|uniref:ABC transporter ATP-binding protein n=1 Tax=unclassified Clostridioides TaxID=2635829 RepID=UPI001D113618|nr:ABC transporter ATP-binding protein [Clostridioides sp. ZZV14-6150]MCC0659517.1 ABC transporter ATP-binding protein [Clostridioides sp. ZZV14-6154]MCC0666970.1 ABC transporter ATP-binding protein [Clostridioides sp. ZZV14-6153]MCC0719391.1 ABC transporter ATP-binding protein [Clostridioides sp. ZZV14-6105]MCC0723738.1 ABC transporter ATP-binding protein [Clostridioides sp. ZZV14-6104]MCC0737851.1 ABC transporter ATP-binding protein [Clostridioides sp. ZZV14-5902]MCC0742219.1 ABC transporte
MEKIALELKGITKQYKDFKLDNISFKVPQGSIVGLIGENGAGKSTTINAILGLTVTEQGEVSVFNGKSVNAETKEHIGVVFDGSNYPDSLTPKKLGKVFQNIYKEWDSQKYLELLNKFELPVNKKLKEYSKGMKMKYSISVALSHNSKLLILDEATSGLDPIIRDDILEMFLDFIQDEEHSILVSSHITSDLEKIADYIVFIHKGKVLFSKPKDELLEKYGIIKCNSKQFNEIDKADIIAYRKQDYEWQILISNRQQTERKYPKIMIVPASIDEIMLMYVKGDK